MSRARDLADLGGSADAGGLTGRNLIINGGMTVAQRGTQTNQTTAYTACDRFQFVVVDSSAVVTSTQSTTVPSGQGFASSLKLDVTTADSSLASSDLAFLRQTIESQNLQHLNYGTSGAKSLTLSFWVRSSKTGTHIAELRHDDATYFNSQIYTISSANTWQKVTLTYDGYVTTALNNDNGAGIKINWWLAGGSTYSGGTLSSNTWQNTQANRAVGQVNVMDSTSNNFYITGVQLEVGETATPFEHEDYGTTLRKCQRYFELLGHATNAGSADTFSLMSLPFNGATNNQWIDIPFMVEKRAAPTSIVAFNGYALPSATVVGFSTNGMTLFKASQMYFTKSSGGSQGDAVASVSAEL